MEREEWLTGQGLIDRWQIEDFELFEYLKKGLQAYTWHGKRIVDEATLERGRRDSKETIRKNVLAKQRASTLGAGPVGHGPLSESEIEQQVNRLYNRQEEVSLNPPKDALVTSFHLRLDTEKAQVMIDEAKAYRFKLSDVEHFEIEHNFLCRNGTLASTQSEALIDQFLSPQQIMEKWHKNATDLLHYAILGLPVYDPENPSVPLQVVQERGKYYFKTESTYYPLEIPTAGLSNWRRAHPLDPHQPHVTAFNALEEDRHGNVCVFKLSAAETFGRGQGLPSILSKPHDKASHDGRQIQPEQIGQEGAERMEDEGRPTEEPLRKAETPLRLMEVQEADERKYKELNLHKLVRVTADFLTKYSFLQAAYLCSGSEIKEEAGETRLKNPYHLLFELPLVIPIDMRARCIEFNEAVDSLLYRSLPLRGICADPDISIDMWRGWRIMDISDIKNDPISEFVQTLEAPLCLCTRKARQETATKKAREKRVLSAEDVKQQPPEDRAPARVQAFDHNEDFSYLISRDAPLRPDQRETPVGQARYSFVKDGPEWVLVYAGKRTGHLFQKGFAVIHYLVSNQRKPFTPNELQQEFDPAAADAVKASGRIDYGDAVYDNKAIKQIRNRYQKLQVELREAEENFDLKKKEKLQEEMDSIEELALNKVGLKGRSRRFTNEDTRKQWRYVQQIKRALEELKDRDEAAYKHFRDSLKPINTFTFRYNPADEIDWFLG
jgi:hypothetical protein